MRYEQNKIPSNNTNLHFVKSNTRTTLEINADWMPVRVLTAKQTIINLMRGFDKGFLTSQHTYASFCAMDESYNQYDWNSWLDRSSMLLTTGHYPLIKTNNKVFALPTIVKVQTRHKHMTKKRKAKTYKPSLSDLFKLYDYTCALTNKRYDPSIYDPYEVFNRDHKLPKSKGGTWDDFNIVLSTKEANTKKADKFSEEHQHQIKVKLRNNPFPYLNLGGLHIQPEWHSLLFKD